MEVENSIVLANEEHNNILADLVEKINKTRKEINEKTNLNNVLKETIENKKRTLDKLRLASVKSDCEIKLNSAEHQIIQDKLLLESALNSQVSAKKSDHLSSNQTTKLCEGEQSNQNEEASMEETAEITKFYNSIPIVEKLQKLEEEYELLKTENTKQNDFKKELIDNQIMEMNKRNQFIVNLVKIIKEIQNIESKISEESVEFNEGVEIRNKKIEELKNKVETAVSDMSETMESCSLGHITLFKIPNIPKKCSKSSFLNSKKNKIKIKSAEESPKETPKIKKIISKPTHSFPVLPLTRSNNTNLIKKHANFQIIENILIKSADVHNNNTTVEQLPLSNASVEEVDNQITNEGTAVTIPLLKDIEIKDETEIINTKYQEPSSSQLSVPYPSSEKLNDEQKLQDDCLNKCNKIPLPSTSLSKENESQNYSKIDGADALMSKELPFLQTETVNDMFKVTETLHSGSAGKYNIESEHELNENSTSSYQTPAQFNYEQEILNYSNLAGDNNHNYDSLCNAATNIAEVELPKEENHELKQHNDNININYVSNNNDEPISIDHDDDDAHKTEDYLMTLNPQHEINNEANEMTEIVRFLNQESSQNSTYNKESSENLLNMNFDEFPSPSNGNSNSEGSEFDFKPENFNLDQLNTNHEEHLFGASDLDFSSDNPFEGDCESFKF